MPRQNRVNPLGEIVATPDRGLFMGNRGCLHDTHGKIRRPWQLERWIICLLQFKGRTRAVMTPGHYTELFFLDEATALAAGHRPCAECRRERFNAFRRALVTSGEDQSLPTAVAIDRRLHSERVLRTARSGRTLRISTNYPTACWSCCRTRTALRIWCWVIRSWLGPRADTSIGFGDHAGPPSRCSRPN